MTWKPKKEDWNLVRQERLGIQGPVSVRLHCLDVDIRDKTLHNGYVNFQKISAQAYFLNQAQSVDSIAVSISIDMLVELSIQHIYIYKYWYVSDV